MADLGIDTVDLGLPGAGPRAVEDVTALALEISNGKLDLDANCAARTHLNDIRPIHELVQKRTRRWDNFLFCTKNVPN